MGEQVARFVVLFSALEYLPPNCLLVYAYKILIFLFVVHLLFFSILLA